LARDEELEKACIVNNRIGTSADNNRQSLRVDAVPGIFRFAHPGALLRIEDFGVSTFSSNSKLGCIIWKICRVKYSQGALIGKTW